MPENLASFKVFAQGGLNLNRDVLSQGEIQPGSAISLLNYEPATTGGYRRVSGYSNDYGTVPGDSSGSVLGVAVAAGINDGILAARKPSSGNNYLHWYDYNYTVNLGTGEGSSFSVGETVTGVVSSSDDTAVPATGEVISTSADSIVVDFGELPTSVFVENNVITGGTSAATGTVTSNGSTAIGWVAVTTSGSPTMTGVSKVRFTRFNWGTPKVILTDGVNPAATYDGTTYTQITASEAPDDPKFAAVFKNHMWLAGDPNEAHNVYFSAPTDETKWAPADGAGVINVGFPVVAIKPFRDSLFIFGTNNIKRIVGNNISDWAVQHVTDDLGCLASDSVVEIGGDLIFLSQDGIRPIGGTDKIGDVNLETLTKNIQSFISDVIFNNDLDAVSSVIIRGKSQFRIFYNVESGNALLGALRQNQQGGISFEFGQMIGIEATCADSGYIDKEEFVIHGDSTGKVHRQESGNSFGGNNIVSLYQTPFLHMQDPEQRKIIHTVATYLRSEGDNEIVMSVVFDYDDTTILNPTNFTLTTEGAAAYYNEAIFDESSTIWSGNPSPVQRVNVSGSGKSVSFRYVTNDTNASHSIQGLVVTFGVGDRL